MLYYLDLPGFLREWFVHDMGGKIPVELPRNSLEHQFFETYLSAPPKEYKPVINRDWLAIKLPSFKTKDTRSCYYLAPKSERALVSIIYNRFDIEMWKHVHKFSAVFKHTKKLIEAFMENHGIEVSDTNYQAVLKRYQRKRDYYLRNFR